MVQFIINSRKCKLIYIDSGCSATERGKKKVLLDVCVKSYQILPFKYVHVYVNHILIKLLHFKLKIKMK